MARKERFRRDIGSMKEAEKEAYYNELKKYVKSMGKTANQRLRELEKQDLARSSRAYSYIESLEFDKDRKAFLSQTGKGEIKFRTATRGVSLESLELEARTIESFIQARTSTTSGVRHVTTEAYEAYKEQYPDKTPSFQDFSEIYTKSLIQNMLSIYGSDKVLQVQEIAGSDITAEEISKVLEEIGLTEQTKEKDKNKPKWKDIVEAFEEFKKSKPNSGGTNLGNRKL